MMIDLAALGPIAPIAGAAATIVGAMLAARREGRRLRADIERNSAQGLSDLAGAYAETTEALRKELGVLREELAEVRAEREDIATELAALRGAVQEALAILRSLPGAEPAIAVLEQPKPRRRRKPSVVDQAA